MGLNGPSCRQESHPSLLQRIGDALKRAQLRVDAELRLDRTRLDNRAMTNYDNRQ
jgi:hypothetical protein